VFCCDVIEYTRVLEIKPRWRTAKMLRRPDKNAACGPGAGGIGFSQNRFV
jgi:hypothetical protein